MGVMNMAKTIKQVHPDYLVMYKAGAFCNIYGKDSYIMASLFDYQMKNKKRKLKARRYLYETDKINLYSFCSSLNCYSKLLKKDIDL